jgi:hypothetical protein
MGRPTQEKTSSGTNDTLIEHLERQNPENYHVRLIAFTVDLAPLHHSEFASYADVKDILLVLAARHAASVPKRETVFTVGNSGEFVYGMIGSDGKHVFINNRMGFLRGTFTEADVQRFHQQYQEYFEYLRSRSGNQGR